MLLLYLCGAIAAFTLAAGYYVRGYPKLVDRDEIVAIALFLAIFWPLCVVFLVGRLVVFLMEKTTCAGQ